MISVGSEVQILPGPPSVAVGQLSERFCKLTTGDLKLSGGVAQLGEHLLCKQGVVGSIPITSIYPDAARGALLRRRRKGNP